jgi:hypothetical protein
MSTNAISDSCLPLFQALELNFKTKFLEPLAPKPVSEDKLFANGSWGLRVTLYIIYGRSEAL